MAQIIDGRAVGQRMQAEIAQDVAAFKQQYGYAPGLGVVMAGDDPASQMYVRMKRRVCGEVGIESVASLVDANTSQAEVEQAVRDLNENPAIHGILVQLPLPPHIN